MPKLTKRTVLASLGAGALVVAVAGVTWRTLSPGRPASLRMILNWKYQGPQGWFFLAQDRGYFAAEGFDVLFDQGDGSAAAVPKVASGAYDVGFGDINALIEFAASRPSEAPVGVFMLYNNPPFTIAVRADSGIVEPKDLEGRRLGGPANDGARKLFPAFCRYTNIDPTKIEITTLQPNLREQLLLRGEVDGVFGYLTTIRFGLKQLGADPEKEVRWLNYGAYGLDLYSNAIIASRALVSDHPQAVAGFLRAVNKGIRDALEDPAAAVEAVRKREPLINVALELERFRATLGEMNNPEIEQIGLGDVLDERLARSIDIVTSASGLSSKPTATQVFVRDFLPPLSDRPRSLS